MFLNLLLYFLFVNTCLSPCRLTGCDHRIRAPSSESRCKITTETDFCQGQKSVSGNLNSQNPDKHRRFERFVCAHAREEYRYWEGISRLSRLSSLASSFLRALPLIQQSS